MINPSTPNANFTDLVPLSSLLRHVMPIVPQLPHEMALDSIRQSYIELTRRSSILVVKLQQDYQAGVHDYPIDIPEGYEMYQLMGLAHPNFRYVDYWAGANYGLWNTRFDVVDNSSLYFHIAPSVDSVGSLIIYAKVLPNNCCETIPSSLATPYGYAIAEGALSKLLLIPNKPWTNPSIAGIHARNYNIAVMSARNLGDTNRKCGPIVPNRIRVV
jgi:hypothetical protein